MPLAATQPAHCGGLFTDREYAYARILPGSSRSWLQMLAAGWSFCDHVVEPMGGHHGRYAVLMYRECVE
jgi:hypothetical protein